MLPASPNPAHEAIAAFAKLHPTSAIVTTNYDCCIDLALGALKLPVTYHLDFAYWREDPGDGISLIKLHGSLNWYYCETCQKVQCLDIKSTVEDYKADMRPFSVIAICKDCGGQRRGLLLPPWE
jgi:NAD-dependent SIR2 family protein deacetylase